VPVELGSRGGSDKEIEGSGREIDEGLGDGVPVGSRGGNDKEIEGSGREIDEGSGDGVPVGSRGGSDKEIEGSGREIDEGLGDGVPVGSRGGNDNAIEGGGSDREIEGSLGREIEGTRVPVGIPVESESRGGKDREIEGSGSKIGGGVTVGSGPVLVEYPSSRLKTKPLARAAKRREEKTTLENMISKIKSREA